MMMMVIDMLAMWHEGKSSTDVKESYMNIHDTDVHVGKVCE